MKHINSSYSFEINDNNGSLVSFKKGNQEFIGEGCGSDLFVLRFRNSAGAAFEVPSSSAGKMEIQKEQQGTEINYRLNFVDLKLSQWFPQTMNAQVTIRCPEDEAMSYWSISTQFSHNALTDYLEYIQFPCVTLNNTLKAQGGEDEFFWPFNEGCLIDDILAREDSPNYVYRPVEYPSGGWYGLYPGPIQMQFMALTGKEGSFYIASYDGEGYPKEINWTGDEEDINLIYKVFCGGARTSWSMPYEMVLGVFDGDWQDAADLYRDWSKNTVVKDLPLLEDNTRIPDWMKESPVVVTYGATGPGADAGPTEPNLYAPFANVIPYLEKYEKAFDTKLINLLMHWEGTAPWSPPYVWPPMGGEEAFKAYAKELHDRGYICGLYCSGTSWTQFSSTGKGTYDQRQRFIDDNMAPEMATGPTGEMTALVCNNDAIRWGYDFCPTSDKLRTILSGEVLKMQEAGVDYIQLLDQNLGASPYFCYNEEHGHPAGPGAWETEAMNGLIEDLQSALDENGETILGCEAGVAESFMKNLPLNDLRFNGTFNVGKPVPAYAHVFHEYIYNFQGNQVATAVEVKMDTTPHHVQFMTAYSFCAGDLLTIILRDKGEINWGWCCSWDTPKPDQQPIIDLIANLTAWRKGQAKDWLHYGKMQKALALSGLGTYSFEARNGREIAYPTMLTTRWQYKGDEIQLIVNYLPEDQECQIGLEKGVSARLYTKPGIDSDSVSIDGNTKIRVPGLSAVMVSL